MIVKEPSGSLQGVWTGAAILLVGLLIGALTDPMQLIREAGSSVGADIEGVIDGDRELHRYLRDAPGPAPPAENDLPTLSIRLSGESARVIQGVRSDALDHGVIVQTDEDTVPVQVEFEGREIPAKARIKGDWIDHVDSDQWSLRIELDDGDLMGMRVFSIQHPKTRGWLWEWFVLETMRREDVIAPRATFVNVVINGNPTGIYYLEEHFSKELLESQGRREGPIVVWDEDALWSTLLQTHAVRTKGVNIFKPKTSEDTKWLAGAFSRAYGEKRLSSIESLNRSLYSAIEQMDTLLSLAVAADSSLDRLRRLEALSAVGERTMESVVNTDRLSCAHALASLFQLEHSLVWQNMRFYHDPVLDRLEPIMFDNMAAVPGPPDPVMFYTRNAPLMDVLVQSREYYNGVFRYLGRFCEPSYLDELFDELGPELERFESALLTGANVPPSSRVGTMMQRLRKEQVYLRSSIYPVASLHVGGVYELSESAQALVSGELEITAWAFTQTPTVLEGFRFANGVFIPAFPNLVGDPSRVAREGEAGVVLPRFGGQTTFRFPMDERLASLETVRQVKQAVIESADPGAGLALDLDAVYRPIATAVQESMPIRLRRRDPAWIQERGRPEAPTLEEALERHPFLSFDPVEQRLVLAPGTWTVDGDLLIPSGYPLHGESVTSLRFEQEAVFLTDAPLRLVNVTLEPVAGAQSWSGLIVLGADERSLLRSVTVRNTSAVARAGWVLTGGITFYRSPVTLINCLIDGTLAEDGLNVFGADLLMDGVDFHGCLSDSFDGDFVTGTISNCRFREGLADGIDVSGSDLEVVDCLYLNMGDKAVSVGEDSTVRIRGGTAQAVSIGIAVKDGSDVDAQGMVIREARNYALAAYIKKPVYGPSQLSARGLSIEGSGLGASIVQTGCVLEVDGVAQPTQDLDVKQLYADKVLGQ